MKLTPENKTAIQEKTKAFFRSQRWKDVLVFLVFVVLVSGFWFMQQLKENRTSATNSGIVTQERTLANDSLTGNRKKIPVRLNGLLSPAAGFQWTDSLRIEPATVWIYGDKKILDSLQWIPTASVNEKNIRNTIDLTLKLNLPKGLQSPVQKVRLTGAVEEFTEKKIELPVVCRNLPESVYMRFFPSTVEVVCRLSMNHYSLLNAEDLEVGVDYEVLSKNQEMNISLTLFRKPQWLIDCRIVPETVEYLIEQKQEL